MSLKDDVEHELSLRNLIALEAQKVKNQLEAEEAVRAYKENERQAARYKRLLKTFENDYLPLLKELADMFPSRSTIWNDKVIPMEYQQLQLPLGDYGWISCFGQTDWKSVEAAYPFASGYDNELRESYRVPNNDPARIYSYGVSINYVGIIIRAPDNEILLVGNQKQTLPPLSDNSPAEVRKAMVKIVIDRAVGVAGTGDKKTVPKPLSWSEESDFCSWDSIRYRLKSAASESCIKTAYSATR